MSNTGGLSGLLAELAILHAAAQTAVLGIVTHTEGSTYQKPGALLLLDSHGMRHGALSGGCLEPQVEEEARRTLEAKRARVAEFDTRTDDDLIYGSGTGCRGRTQLLLAPQPPGAPLTEALGALACDAEPLQLELVIHGDAIGAGSASLRNRRWQWESSGLASVARSDLHETTPLTIQSPPRILMLGAGPETAPFVAIANRLGWRVRVVEHRGRWLAFARAAGVTDVLQVPPEEAQSVWSQELPDVALAMTHNFVLDTLHVRYCVEHDVGYVGLLGPKQRRDALLRELGSAVVSQLGARLHAPIGLDLGGSGPDALALAIAAEVQQYLSSRRRVR